MKFEVRTGITSQGVCQGGRPGLSLPILAIFTAISSKSNSRQPANSDNIRQQLAARRLDGRDKERPGNEAPIERGGGAMWRRNAFVVAFLLAKEMATSSSGQQRPVAGLLSQSQWIRFEIVLGRITAVTLSCGPTHCEAVPGTDGVVRELLSFNGDAALPSLVYESQDSQQSLRISVTNRTQVIILREPVSGSPLPPVRFTQSGSGQGVARGRPGCRAAVTRRGEPLAPAAGCPRGQSEAPVAAPGRVASGLAPGRRDRGRRDGAVPGCREFAAAAADCGAGGEVGRPEFSAAASGRARACAVWVYPPWLHLESLDRSRLTGEQRLRVRKLCQEFRSATPDTPDRVAIWLASDEAVWNAWLSQGNGKRRAAAECGLAAIGGRVPPALDRTRLAQLPGRDRD